MRPLLALVTDAFGGRGGIAQYNRDLVTALAPSEWSIDILPRRTLDPVLSLPSGVRQHQARAGHIAYAWAAFALARHARPEIVFCGHLYMAPLAALLSKITGGRLIVQLHGVEAWSRPNALRRAAVDAADLVLCVSRDTRARLLDWCSIAPERVVILPNTVGADFSPAENRSLTTKASNKKILLTVGRLDARERYKGHDRVIGLLPTLVACGHDIKYLIIGDGDDRPRLEALAKTNGIAERVRFLGQVPAKDLADYYRQADLFVMLSTGEGFGIAFLEAMACGTRALGLSVAGAKDALVDGTLGLAADEGGFVAAIADALAKPPHREKLAERVRALFGCESFAARANAIFADFGMRRA